ncbi:MAG: rhodanese-like domain-containing protein [bacterium]
MPKKYLIIILAASVLMFTIVIVNSNSSTSNSNTSTSNSNTSSSSSASSQTSSIAFETLATVNDLKLRLDQKNPGDILLDVRTPPEYSAGHIPGSINIDIENTNFDSQIQKLDKSKTYITFCRSGNRALVGSQKLSELSFKTIYSKQGFSTWQASDLAVEN